MPAKKETQPKPVEMFESALKLFWNGKYEQAIKAFEKIINNHPEEITLGAKINNFINVCNVRLEDEFDPKTAEDFYLTATCHLNNGECKESISWLQKALKKESHNDAYLFTLACAYARCGEKEEAVSTLKQAIRINEQNRFYALNCSDFKELEAETGFFKLLDK